MEKLMHSFLKHDIYLALNQIVRRPLQSFITFLILFIGVSIFIVTYLVFNTIAFKTLNLDDEEKLVIIESSLKNNEYSNGITFQNVENFLEKQNFLSSVARYSEEDFFSIGVGTSPITVMGTSVDPLFFTIVGIKPILGEINLEASTESVVISFNLWKNIYAENLDIIGSKILVQGTEKEIVAVMPKEYKYPIASDVWILLSSKLKKLDKHRKYALIARLQDNVSIEDAKLRLDKLAGENKNKKIPSSLRQGFRVADVKSSYLKNGTHVYVAVIFSSFLVLVISGLSVYGRTLVFEEKFGQHISAKKYLTYGSVLSLLTVIIALIFIASVTDLINSLLYEVVDPTPFWFKTKVDGNIIFLSAVLTVIISLFCFWLPKARLLNLKLCTNSPDEKIEKYTIKKVKIIMSLAISLVIGLAIVSALLVLNSKFTSQTKYGASLESIIAVRYNLPFVSPDNVLIKKHRDFHVRLLNSLSMIHGVISVSAASSSPGSHIFEERYVTIKKEELSNKNPTEGTALLVTIDEKYFETFEIPIKFGHANISLNEQPKTSKVVVSESFSKWFWPDENPIGKQFSLYGLSENRNMEVVGVIPHLILAPLSSPQRYIGSVFQANNYEDIYKNNFIYIKVDGNPSDYFLEVKHKFKEIDSSFHVAQINSLKSNIMLNNAPMRFIERCYVLFLVGSFIILTLGIGSMLFSIIRFRKKHIEISGQRESFFISWLIKKGAAILIFSLPLGIAFGGALIFILEGGGLD
jgi:hypothetical protein